MVFDHPSVYWHPAYSPYWSPMWTGTDKSRIDRDVLDQTADWFGAMPPELKVIWQALASETLFMLRCTDTITDEDRRLLWSVAGAVMGVLHAERSYTPWGDRSGQYRSNPHRFTYEKRAGVARKEAHGIGIPTRCVSFLCEHVLIPGAIETLRRTQSRTQHPIKTEPPGTERVAEVAMEWFATTLDMNRFFPGISETGSNIHFTPCLMAAESGEEGQCHANAATRADIVEKYTKEAVAYQKKKRVEINLASPCITSYPKEHRHFRLYSVVIHENFHIWCKPQKNLILAEGIALYGEVSHLGFIYGTTEFRYGLYALIERFIRPLVDRGMYSDDHSARVDPLDLLSDAFHALVDGKAPHPGSVVDVLKASECRSRYLPGNAGAYATGWLLVLSLRNTILMRYREAEWGEALLRFHSILQTQSSGTILQLLWSLDREFGTTMHKPYVAQPELLIVRDILGSYLSEKTDETFRPIRIDFLSQPEIPFLYPVVYRIE
jgi:hypothetical protein